MGHRLLIHLQLPADLAEIDLPLDGAGKAGQQPHKFLQKAYPALRDIGVIFLSELFHLEIHGAGGALQQQGKPLRAEFFQELIRVLCIRDGEDPHLHPGVLKDGDSPAGGLLPRSVGIVAEDHRIGIIADKAGLLRGEGGAQGGYGVIKAPLVDAYHIHIPLAEDELRALRILGEVEGKEVAALFEDGGIAAVEVFGPLVRKVPAPKGDDPAPQVDDGEDDPVSESVVAAAFFAGAHQGGGNHFLVGEALFPQVVPQVVPAFRGVADAEPDHRGFGKAPVHQVFPGLPAPLGHKVLVEVPGGGAVQLQYPCLSLAAAVVHRPFRDSHPGPLRQTPHRLHIV